MLNSMDRRVAVRAVIVKNGTLLCVRLKPYDDTVIALGDNWWCTPGGSVEPGEGLVAALQREMVEETNVQPVIGAMLYVHQYEFRGKDNLEFFFHVTNAEDYLEIDLSRASHGAKEIAEIGFVNPQKTNILPKFLTTEPIAKQIAQCNPTKIFSYLA